MASLVACTSLSDQDYQRVSNRTYAYDQATILTAAKQVFDHRYPEGYKASIHQGNLTVRHAWDDGYYLWGSRGFDYWKLYTRSLADGQTQVHLDASRFKAGDPGTSVLEDLNGPYTNNRGELPNGASTYNDFYRDLEQQLGLSAQSSTRQSPQ
ncbi:hypothetical protein [Brackiella oedipodis]|uniref:hypothetical protein n=1 Tax=Brackiella oedipodis TaxID=124225 RepID=UPI0012EB53E1|nr:hypothetical protein [Brackiella oedipodis]